LVGCHVEPWWGPPSGVLCFVLPIWVMWFNKGLTCGKLGTEVASCCTIMCQLGFDSLLMWIAVVVPCDIGQVKWSNDRLPHGTLVGPTCQMSCGNVGPTC
jgi:hypothetical protein